MTTAEIRPDATELDDRGGSSTRVPVRRVTAVAGAFHTEAGDDDTVVVEEPMEVRLTFGPSGARSGRTVTVTMRTPGLDFELAMGFLYAEGVIQRREDVDRVAYCGPTPPGRPHSNVVRVDLRPEVAARLEHLARNFVSTSSCGVCGKASLDAVAHALDGEVLDPEAGPRVRASLIDDLPERLRRSQPVFAGTGGLHAAGLFDVHGEQIACCEDIGRHNAVDKLVGGELLAGRLPLADRILVVSGRTSFEVLQKALRARVPILVAVGAPSSLAVELARQFGITLVGFARGGRFNVYAGAARIAAG
jgi:FdhD protein